MVFSFVYLFFYHVFLERVVFVCRGDLVVLWYYFFFHIRVSMSHIPVFMLLLFHVGFPFIGIHVVPASLLFGNSHSSTIFVMLFGIGYPTFFLCYGLTIGTPVYL